MKKIIYIAILFAIICKIGYAQDTCRSKINFILQISAGYFYSNCTNIPADMISKPEPDKGIQLNPQVGFNINWNFVRLGLSLGIVLQKEIREYGDFIIGPKIQVSSEFGNFNNNFPLSFMVLGGFFLQGYPSTDYSPPYSLSFFIGCAPLVRLSKKNASISVLLGPSVEYVFGITQNYEYYLPGPQKGGTLYSFNYNELTGNILIILKFQKKKGSLSKPFPQHPPFFF